MTLLHPTIRQKVAVWQKELRELTGDNTVILTCYASPSFSMDFDELSSIICDVTGVPLERVRSKSRKREVVATRQLIAYCCCEYTSMTLKRIGKSIGDKHHTTVIHARNIVKEHLQSNDSLICKAMAEINERLPIEANKCEVPQVETDVKEEPIFARSIKEQYPVRKIDKETRKYYHTGKLHL